MTGKRGRDERLMPHERAAERYESRIGEWLRRMGLEALQPQMVSGYREQAIILDRVRSAVSMVTDAAGLPGIVRFAYSAFGGQVYKLWRRRKWRGYETELELLRKKWQARGLDPGLLEKVQAAVIAALDEWPGSE